MKILILGGSGGIGSALINAYLALKPNASIYATYHNHMPTLDDPRLQWIPVDTSSEDDIKMLADQIDQLDILINAAGILHTEHKQPEKTIKSFDIDFFNETIAANTTPTLLLAKYFCGKLNSGNPTHFVALSARIGSIEDNKIGGWISYRCSKAALNMALKTISIEWSYKQPNCCVFAFHPGTTDTDLSKPFQKNVPEGKLFSADYVADCLISQIASKTADDSGKFFAFDGEEIPW